MLDIVCCLPCEHDIDSLRFCLVGLFFCTDGEPGPLTCTLSGSRVSGLPTHQPQLMAPRCSTWRTSARGTLLSSLSGKGGPFLLQKGGGLGGLSLPGNVSEGRAWHCTAHGGRSGSLRVLISQVSAAPLAFCLYRATPMSNQALKVQSIRATD